MSKPRYECDQCHFLVQTADRVEHERGHALQVNDEQPRDETLQERLAAYLETCVQARATLQEQSDSYERRAITAYEHRRDVDYRDYQYKSTFAAAQACAYRDVITSLERLLGH
jgi:hypothetical protein